MNYHLNNIKCYSLSRTVLIFHSFILSLPDSFSLHVPMLFFSTLYFICLLLLLLLLRLLQSPRADAFFFFSISSPSLNLFIFLVLLSLFCSVGLFFFPLMNQRFQKNERVIPVLIISIYTAS